MDRPRVVIHGEVSVDGRLTLAPDVLLLFDDERWRAVAGSSGVYDWVKSTHRPQCYLEGSASFVKSDAEPEPLPPFEGNPKSLCRDFLPDAVVHRPGHRGWFTVVDSRGRVRGWLKEWPGEEYAGWHLLVLVSHQTPAEYLAHLQSDGIPYLVAGEERVDLPLALEKLKAKLDVTSVLSTSPGKLGGALLRAGLVDEISIEFFPAIIGGFETPSLFESPELKADEWPTRLELISAQVQAEGNVWLRYRVVSQTA
jgi:2,5-diamino-6-(ribosylamino)-4(3H)-pyrimidinone 5'-phosphate reductase